MESYYEDLIELVGRIEDLAAGARAMALEAIEQKRREDAINELVTPETPNEFH